MYAYAIGIWPLTKKEKKLNTLQNASEAKNPFAGNWKLFFLAAILSFHWYLVIPHALIQLTSDYLKLNFQV